MQKPHHCSRPQTTPEDIRLQILDHICNTRLRNLKEDTISKWFTSPVSKIGPLTLSQDTPQVITTLPKWKDSKRRGIKTPSHASHISSIPISPIPHQNRWIRQANTQEQKLLRKYIPTHQPAKRRSILEDITHLPPTSPPDDTTTLWNRVYRHLSDKQMLTLAAIENTLYVFWC